MRSSVSAPYNREYVFHTILHKTLKKNVKQVYSLLLHWIKGPAFFTNIKKIYICE